MKCSNYAPFHCWPAWQRIFHLSITVWLLEIDKTSSPTVPRIRPVSHRCFRWRYKGILCIFSENIFSAENRKYEFFRNRKNRKNQKWLKSLVLFNKMSSINSVRWVHLFKRHKMHVKFMFTSKKPPLFHKWPGQISNSYDFDSKIVRFNAKNKVVGFPDKEMIACHNKIKDFQFFNLDLLTPKLYDWRII